MSGEKRGLCPICRIPVNKTPMGKIGGHLDKARNFCEYGSGESYTLTVAVA